MSRAGSYFARRPDPLTSLVLTVPVFLTYHLGILFVDLRNGADLVSELMLAVLDRSAPAYAALTLVFAAGIAATAHRAGKAGALRRGAFGGLVLESTLWAICMLFTVGYATERLLGLAMGGVRMGVLDRLVMAAGAGFHEELVFRVGLLGGLAVLIRRWLPKQASRAWLVAAVVSSLVFSWVHYLGPLGDDLELPSFTFRALAGMFFATLYRFRGFAVVVYTHMIYDLMVFFVL